MTYRIDENAWPILFIQDEGVPTQADVDQLEAVLERVFARGERFLCISDATGAETSAASRKMQSTLWAKVEARTRALCAATIIITDSPFMRAGLKAIFWFYTPPTPTYCVATYAEAARCARDHALENRMALGATAERRLREWSGERQTKLG